MTSVALLLGVGAVAGYAMSCAKSSDRAAKEPQIPALSRLVELMPRVEPTAEPAALEPAEVPTVAAMITAGCSTTLVKGLSEQLIAEGNCLVPGAYLALPKLDNVILGDAVFPYMREPARDALVEVLKRAKGRKMKINSMLRTVAQQFLLHQWYRRKRCSIGLAAEPGKSNHQSGLAIDIAWPSGWRKRLGRAGFRWLGKRDRWHFDFKMRRRGKAGKSLDVRAFQQLWNRNHPAEVLVADGGWGPDTENALRRSPAGGFTYGAQCTAR